MKQPVKKSVFERQPETIQLVGSAGEISKKDLKVVKQRFLNLHKIKMQRALDALPPRQKTFLELLPLFFHVNHPVLPGYVSAKTPAGIADYSPSKLTLDQAKKFGHGFVYSKKAKRSFGIESIFLMGSVGSIAFVKGSDMDLWLCYSSGLSTEDLALLQEKASGIEKWAMSLGLEVHFFLMNAESFKQGEAIPLSSESSGSTQHHLLLEEFYRTALYVAGRYPVWWLVPPEAENNYQEFVDNLLKQRFIERHDVIDFGGLEKVPAEEFLGASLWHLYKAIDSPYKSLLKLMLMESYVDQYPHYDWAALKMKRRVYAGESDPNKLDPYLILYAALDEYLRRKNQPQRLNLMRYCFFNKLNESGLGASKSLKNDWRQQAFNEVLSDWGQLPDYLVDALDNQTWDITLAQQEKERLTKELTHNYELLMRFAKDRIGSPQRDNEELTLLGRKLNAALERRPGKLERSSIKNTRIREENKVVLKQITGAAGSSNWQLSRLDINAQEQAVRQSRSLLELLAWCVDSAAIGAKTKIALNPGKSHISSREVSQTLQGVAAFFNALTHMPTDLDVYRYKPAVTDVMLVINSGLDPLNNYTEQGINLTSERSDALSFGSQRRNLVHTTDMMFRNSWNEVIVGKYDAMDGLMSCVCELFDQQLIGAKHVPPTLVCTSYNSPRAMSVSKRVQRLIEDIARVFKSYGQQNSPRFIIQSGRSYYLMQVRHRKMTATAVAEKGLIRALSDQQAVYSPIYFDKFIDQQGLLPVVCGHHKAGLIQLYYVQTGARSAQVYILDEKGSLFFKQCEFVNEQVLLLSYKTLLDCVIQRRRLAGYGLQSNDVDFDIECYRLEEIRQHWALHKVTPPEVTINRQMAVRVAFDNYAKELHIYCNTQTFSSLEHGEKLYNVVASHIKNERKALEDYPVYITDIDVPHEELGVSEREHVQTIHFLQYKQRIEAKLNV